MLQMPVARWGYTTYHVGRVETLVTRMKKIERVTERQRAWLACGLCLLVGYFTAFRGYESPAFFFWDENYHVAHAQKYLHGVFFMEPHPPLGKLLIALGEAMVGANASNDQFIGTDHAKNTPEGFSFKGYRFFPALFTWLAAPVFFWFFFLITGRHLWALCLSGLYLFDNALLVHGRGAMLESIQIFFVAWMLLAFIMLWRRERSSTVAKAVWAIVLGAAFGAVIVTKVNGLILVILFPLLFWQLRAKPKKAFLTMSWAVLGGMLVYCGVWWVHFSVARSPDARLPNQGWYQASAEYKAIVSQGREGSLLVFPTLLRDSFSFVAHYQRGVPRLNLCNQNENGSPAIFWPFGARAINYRWERNEGLTRYLYLVPNPVGWMLALGGVAAGVGLLLGSWVLALRRRLRSRALILGFSAMYLGYMVVMLNLPRVMYLYHYFIPLICGFVLVALVLREWRYTPRLLGRMPAWGSTALPLLLLIAQGAAFWFMSPLTYAKPLSDEQLRSRNLFTLWDIRPAGADPVNGIAKPLCDPKVKPYPQVRIGSVRASRGYQEWGEPQQNLTVDSRPIVLQGQRYESGIGVHARSELEFPLQAAFRSFSGRVGLPDYILQKAGSIPQVRFSIVGDGKSLWESPVVSSASGSVAFEVDVADVRALTLRVDAVGGSIDNCHAVWAEPMLRP